MSAPTTAIIVGGGIGGLTASLALRAVGIDAQVYEGSSDPRKMRIGGGMTIFQNAMAVLEQVDLADAVAATGVRMRAMEFRSPRGLRFATWPLERIESDLGRPAIALTRADLQGVLVDACQGHLHTSARLDAFEQRGDRVTATFTDGSSATADLLIGADGLASAVRTQLSGHCEPRYLGYTQWQSIVELKPAGADGTGDFVHWWGRGAGFGYYDVGHGRTHWFATNAAPAGGTDPASGPKDELLDLFGAWQAPIREMIELTPTALISRADIRDLPYQPVWGKGRVSLLGDAAHAMSFNVGQGAGQAMEDAATLAARLVEARDVESALRAYEQQRQAATKPLAALARRIGGWSRWRNPAAMVARYPLLLVGLRGPGYLQHRRNASVAVPALSRTPS